VATRYEIGTSSQNNDQGNENGPSLPEVVAELLKLDQPFDGLHELPCFWMTDEEFADHLDSTRTENDVQNEEQQPVNTPVPEGANRTTPTSPVSRNEGEQVATTAVEAPCNRVDLVWVALCAADLPNAVSLGGTSHTPPRDANQSSMHVKEPMPGTARGKHPTPPPSAAPTTGLSPQPGPSHSPHAAGPSKGPSNRYKGGQKRAADEDVKDLGSTKRCRTFRENKKVKLSEEEEEVKALEEKNKQLTEQEEMMIRKLSAAQAAYIRLIKKGVVKFSKT